jgi:hypothetical protein
MLLLLLPMFEIMFDATIWLRSKNVWVNFFRSIPIVTKVCIDFRNWYILRRKNILLRGALETKTSLLE